MPSNHATHDDLPEDLEDLWEDFRRSLNRRNRSAETIGLYRRKYVAFWRWALDAGLPPDPAAVDHRAVNRWLDHLVHTPVVRNGRPVTTVDPATGAEVPKMLEASTLRIFVRNVRPFFSWYAAEFETTNPFDRADRPDGEDSALVPVIELDHMRRLLAACEGRGFEARRDTAIVLTMADTGARAGELAGLRIEDWDRRLDMLALDGKTGQRIVPVGVAAGEALARYLRVRKMHSRASLPAMWLGAKGRLGQSGISQMIRRRCEETGIPHINPHRFRHTWAHEFRAAGGSEGDLMYLAGWSSTAMAHRYGVSAAAERAQRAARSLSLGDRLSQRS